MSIKKMTAVAAICVAAALPTLAGTGKSISINFAGPRDSTANPGDSAFSTVSGSALFGALPVAGDNWNNFQTHSSTHGSGVASASSIKLNDGTVAAGVSASWNASCTWSVSTSSSSDNIFNSFLDGSAAQTLTISGLTAENGFPSTCTVYIYCASDRASSKAVFCPKTVNGTTYTYANGAVTAGTTSWGSYTYAQNNKLVLGGDYLKIEGVEITDGTVTISYAAASDGTTTKYHGERPRNTTVRFPLCRSTSVSAATIRSPSTSPADSRRMTNTTVRFRGRIRTAPFQSQATFGTTHTRASWKPRPDSCGTTALPIPAA